MGAPTGRSLLDCSCSCARLLLLACSWASSDSALVPTSAGVVDKFGQDIARALDSPDVRNRLAKHAAIR
jgi:hypothetical protein